MVGRARKKENSAAAVLDNFRDIPPTILAPLLDRPGFMGKPSQSPILSAMAYEISVLSESPNQSSTFKRIQPPITHEIATVMRFSNRESIKSLKNTPKITAGIRATQS